MKHKDCYFLFCFLLLFLFFVLFLSKRKLDSNFLIFPIFSLLPDFIMALLMINEFFFISLLISAFFFFSLRHTFYSLFWSMFGQVSINDISVKTPEIDGGKSFIKLQNLLLSPSFLIFSWTKFDGNLWNIFLTPRYHCLAVSKIWKLAFKTAYRLYI